MDLLTEYKQNYERIEKAWRYFDRADVSQEDKEKHYAAYKKLIDRQGFLQNQLQRLGVDYN